MSLVKSICNSRVGKFFIYRFMYQLFKCSKTHCDLSVWQPRKEPNIKGKDGEQQRQQQQQINQVVGKISKVFLGKITVAILICSMCSYL